MSRANARPRVKKSVYTKKTKHGAIHETAPAGSKVLRKFYESKHGPVESGTGALLRAKAIRAWNRSRVA